MAMGAPPTFTLFLDPVCSSVTTTAPSPSSTAYTLCIWELIAMPTLVMSLPVGSLLSGLAPTTATINHPRATTQRSNDKGRERHEGKATRRWHTRKFILWGRRNMDYISNHYKDGNENVEEPLKASK